MDLPHDLDAFKDVIDHFTDLLPTISTSAIVIIAAIIPIYIGAHASLSRPTTAAKPSKKAGHKRRSKSSGTLRQGLTPADAIMLPVACGTLLTGMYYLIKWLEDPALLNKILTIQQSLMGTFSIWQLVHDSLTVFYSFIFPTTYSRAGNVWRAVDGGRRFITNSGDNEDVNHSPLPGLLSRIPLPKWLTRAIWSFREARTQPYAVIEIFAKGMGHIVTDIHESADLAAIIAVSAVLYCNFVSNPWWLTNLYGISFCYSAFQFLSPTTFWTGTMIMISLFFYDIYFVFFTPIMLTVATKMDTPAGMLLIPNTKNIHKSSGKSGFNILGLGDIVLPGMMLCLALRFDLYMFYLKKQEQQNVESPNETSDDSKEPETKSTLIKAEYIQATGTWGERFWLDSREARKSGGCFPKPYFSAGVIGYVFGMIVTTTVLHIFNHGQPALLYLVPSVLGALWSTAAIRGEIKHMWMYTEDEEAEKSKKDTKAAKLETSASAQTEPEKSESEWTKEQKDSDKKITSQPEKDSKLTSTSDTPSKEKEDRRIFYFSITEPEKPNARKNDIDNSAATENTDSSLSLSVSQPAGDIDSESSFEVLSQGEGDADADTKQGSNTVDDEVGLSDEDGEDDQARKKQRKA